MTMPIISSQLRRNFFGVSTATNSGVRMSWEQLMTRYEKGDHVKFEVTHERPGDSEWIWLLVDDSNDEQQVVFGHLKMKKGNQATSTK